MTESIAPGYFEVIDIPMDYSTVEKRVESNYYQDKDQVRVVYSEVAARDKVSSN